MATDIKLGGGGGGGGGLHFHVDFSPRTNFITLSASISANVQDTRRKYF